MRNDDHTDLSQITRFDQLVHYLRDSLGWPLSGEDLEELAFVYTPEELGIDKSNASNIETIQRLRPLATNQPWAIFLVRFQPGRLLIGTLRTILRAFVHRKRQQANAADRQSWHAENMLFICAHKHELVDAITFVHFGHSAGEGRAAKLTSFGWTATSRNRTVVEFNLPPLRWPADTSSSTAWHNRWIGAFDKQKLTNVFFQEYQAVFAILQSNFTAQTGDAVWAHDYALQFLNRCIFIYFIQRKRWLNGDLNFLKTFWTAYRESSQPPDSFFANWLKVMFFEAFNEKFHGGRTQFPSNISDSLQLAPFLNGGLFKENELDRQHSISLSDDRFLQVLMFLDRYNFTVSEDTPLNQEVAVDAEMLGRVYESLVNLSEEADDRGDAGIFFTPRTEIDLMCRLALVDHLSNHLGCQRKPYLYNAIFAYGPDEKRNADACLERENIWPELDALIARITVVDPACGSGSFLIGMLQVLDDLLERANRVLGRQETPYERRKRIIGQSLYGVDAMRWAVDVAELRLWLQLIIETDLEMAELKFRPLLPNLSFKVRCGDSLVQELGGVSFGHTRQTSDVPAPLRGRLTRLRGEKLKYFNNDEDARFKTRESLEREEQALFLEILISRQESLGQRVKRAREALDANVIDLFAGETARITGARRRDLESEAELLAVELSKTESALEALRRSKATPFVWDVAFVEVFRGDRRGFDVVIGNPPYVRQEKIADPNVPKEMITAEIRRRYRGMLATSVYAAYPAFFGYKASRDVALHKLDGKSDLYVYFYFHGLSLVADKGAFCFITSNSWLDAGYGADLQEFLLRQCHIKLILDNQTERTFASADVNTVICLFSPPAERRDWGLQCTARFVMFKVPFEEVLSPAIFTRIEGTSERETNLEYSIFPIGQQRLLEEGCQAAVDLDRNTDSRGKATHESPRRPLIKVTRYVGNKWGGKYLRAPDIYWTLLRRGKSALGCFGDHFEGERYLNTGGADGFFVLTEVSPAPGGCYLVHNTHVTQSTIKPFEGELEKRFLVPLIKETTKLDKRIEIQESDAYCLVVSQTPSKKLEAYIRWGESNGYHARSVTRHQKPWYKPTRQMLSAGRFLVPRSFNDTFAIYHNPRELLSLRFYRLHRRKATGAELPLLGFLNSTLVAFFLEVLGNKSMGQGVLEFFMADFLSMQIPIVATRDVGKAIDRMKNRPIESVWQEYGIPRSSGMKSKTMPKPPKDRSELDGVVFDELHLSQNERSAVYEAVVTLVEARLDKAGSLNPKRRRGRADAVRRTMGIWPGQGANDEDDEALELE